MSRTARALLAALFLVLLPVAASPVTIHVPGDESSLWNGINAASSGDTILVGSYIFMGSSNRNLDFGGKNITFMSSWGPDLTIIDCANVSRAFIFHSGEDTTAVVRGFTIRNAVADSGGGVFCTGGASPRFEDCKFLQCNAQKYGGGICCDASSPVIRDCEFSSNISGDVGRSDGLGAGVACLSGSSPRITDTVFSANEALIGGGGLYSSHSSPQLTRCDFLENRVAEYGLGCGVALSSSDGTTVTDCEFQENGTSDCVGGGMHVSSSTITVTDSDFVGNFAGASGGIHFAGANTSVIDGCTFVGNTTNWSAGGAVLCYSGASPTLTNCTFVGNSRHQIWCDTASPTLEYCIIAFSPDGLGVYCETGTENPSIDHCFVFGNAESDSLCGTNCHDNEFGDPCFCAFESGDVTLCADSPCLPGATWTMLVGAEGQGCVACGSAVEDRTWGAIKAMYR